MPYKKIPPGDYPLIWKWLEASGLQKAGKYHVEYKSILYVGCKMLQLDLIPVLLYLYLFKLYGQRLDLFRREI